MSPNINLEGMALLVRKLLFVCWLLIISGQASAFGEEYGGCRSNCFATEIVNVTTSEDGCLNYELRVYITDDCRHALSHYTVEIPTDVNITHVSNSENWAQEIGLTDPTTGLYGFKIDDIDNFGEDCGPDEDQSFTVNFTICGTSSCETDLSCWAPKVAYKAGRCVYYEETEYECAPLEAHLETQAITCNGSADGSIAVVIDEGDGPFTYNWSNGGTTQVIDGIGAGNYDVIVTDGTGNTVELSATLSEPAAITADAQIINASCPGSSDGAIDLTVSNGTGSYTYQWSTGAETEDLDGLAGGSYNVTITDSEGCSISESFTVGNDVNITISGTVTKASCSTDDGAVDITVSGGTTPYTFTWNNGASSEDLTELAPGIYKVTVADANGCTANATYVVQEANPIMLSASTTQTGCVENSSGSIDLTVSGGAAPYTYTWDNGATTEDLEGLEAGMYTVDVTDQNGCSTTLRAVVTSQSFDVSPTVTSVSCAGESDGSITVIPSGGVEPYTYEWSNGATTSTIDGLASNLYRVTITGAQGCSKQLSYYVTQPAAVTASASVTNPDCAAEGYAINITVSGGSGSYTYEWSDGSTTQNLDSLSTGEYTLTVTDTKGCATSISVVVDNAAAGCDDNDDGDGDGDDGDDDDGDGDDGDDDDGGDDGDDSDGGDGDDGDDDDDGDNGDGGDDDDEDNGDGDDDDDNGDDGDDDGGDDSCENPFDSEIELIDEKYGCYTYKLTVEYNGDHSFGLSHLTVELPCGDLAYANNSGNWPIEEGTDPTTGLSGFKVDNIQGFGEGSTPDSFEVIFKVCKDSYACKDILEDADFDIAYKFGQCVDYEEVDGDDQTGGGEQCGYPNPFTDHATIEFSSPVNTHAVVEIYDHRGIKVKTIFNGEVEARKKKRVKFYADDMPNDIYTYRIRTSHRTYHGRLIKH